MPLMELLQPDPNFGTRAEVLALAEEIFKLPAVERPGPGEIRMHSQRTVAGVAGYLSLRREMPKFDTQYQN